MKLLSRLLCYHRLVYIGYFTESIAQDEVVPVAIFQCIKCGAKKKRQKAWDAIDKLNSEYKR